MAGNLIFDTNTLVGVVPNLKRPQKFLLDRFFPNIVTSDTEYVSIDVDVGKRRMSPFVSPLVEGKMVESRRFQTNTFKPAYIKDKRAPDLMKPVRRVIGEQIGGNLSGAEREMANLYAELEDQIECLDRRLEWMAAQALLNGSVKIEGEGYDSVIVDFGRDPELTIALTGSDSWSSPTPTRQPTKCIEHFQKLILKKSGAVTNDIVFSDSAWEAFCKDPIIEKSATIFPTLNPNGNVINPGAEIETGAVQKGVWGNYRLWLYNDWYVDDNDVELPIIPDGHITMAGPSLMGTRAFGQIIDPKFSYASLPYAPKTWVSDDPAQRFLMMQSAPIVIPSRVNACLSAKVV